MFNIGPVSEFSKKKPAFEEKGKERASAARDRHKIITVKVLDAC